MFCVILKRHSCEPELELIYSVTCVFIIFMYIDVGIESAACAHSSNMNYDVYFFYTVLLELLFIYVTFLLLIALRQKVFVVCLFSQPCTLYCVIINHVSG